MRRQRLRSILLNTKYNTSAPYLGRCLSMNDQPRSLASTLFSVGLLLIAMASIQSGASLAKSMFPIIGAQGTTTLRLTFASVIMVLLLRPWRAKLTAKSLRTVIAVSYTHLTLPTILLV